MGFQVVRQRGSHVQVLLRRPDGSVVTFPVPVHAGKTLKSGTLHGIMRLAGLNRDDLLQLL
jgi:predicted RNA binding protein YcfA (HicA-like mRNA interferase family)